MKLTQQGEVIDAEQQLQCYHCGDDCNSLVVSYDQKKFCCKGCSAVYEILQSSGLTTYYQLESTPGIKSSSPDEGRFSYLDNQEVQQRLLSFKSETLAKVQLFIPEIHCSSCIWLLENLRPLNSGILSSRANLMDREIAVDYDPRMISLRQLVELLATIGYEPQISLERQKSAYDQTVSRKLVTKIAVAGFCFGNIMLLSFPEYLGFDSRMEGQLAAWFSWISVLLSLPVLFYCASGYFKSAINGLKRKHLNLDVPISLGILALALQSYYEILLTNGTGYLDSLAGLLFLLLIGQWFQQKTYRSLSFKRDFKDYFPLAVTVLDQGGKEQVEMVDKLRPGAVILIRNQQLVPADSVLIDDEATIDYSFVSGESLPVSRSRGDLIYAGGRHLGIKARYRVQEPVSQSYLTQLWNHQAFQKPKDESRQQLIDSVSKYFTLTVLALAIGAGLYWWSILPEKAVFVFTSVLIVACPCALAMATPFALGHTLRVFGKNGLYLKNAQVIHRLNRINQVVFDKTGTLTETGMGNLSYSGTLTEHHAMLLAALCSQSNHPVSRQISEFFNQNYQWKMDLPQVQKFAETPGKGITGVIEGHLVKIGSTEFAAPDQTNKVNASQNSSRTYLVVDQHVLGYFNHESTLRAKITGMIAKLKDRFELTLLSGDGDKQKEELSRLLPGIRKWMFNQSPIDKLNYVQQLNQEGNRVMMVGDGLNDAGALQSSTVGLAVSENPQHFSPACDGILHAGSLNKLPLIITLAKWAHSIVIVGIIISFIYNLVGLSFAVSGNLTPLVAAVLMPVSSISVVVFATLAVKVSARKLSLY